MKNYFFTGITAVLLLAVLSFFTACSGAFIDPGAGIGGSGGYDGGSGDDGGDDGASSLVAKWYGTQENADAEAGTVLYEFRSNGDLLVTGMSGFTYSVSGNTITIKVTVSGITNTGGTAKWSVSGTKLTISGASLTSGIANGTYYKKQ